MKTIRQPLNTYLDLINSNNMFVLISDLDYVIQSYESMYSTKLDFNKSDVEIIPSQRRLNLYSDNKLIYTSVCTCYGYKNFVV